jgi:hypothetical protein
MFALQLADVTTLEIHCFESNRIAQCVPAGLSNGEDVGGHPEFDVRGG